MANPYLWIGFLLFQIAGVGSLEQNGCKNNHYSLRNCKCSYGPKEKSSCSVIHRNLRGRIRENLKNSYSQIGLNVNLQERNGPDEKYDVHMGLSIPSFIATNLKDENGIGIRLRAKQKDCDSTVEINVPISKPIEQLNVSITCESHLTIKNKFYEVTLYPTTYAQKIAGLKIINPKYVNINYSEHTYILNIWRNQAPHGHTDIEIWMNKKELPEQYNYELLKGKTIIKHGKGNAISPWLIIKDLKGGIYKLQISDFHKKSASPSVTSFDYVYSEIEYNGPISTLHQILIVIGAVIIIIIIIVTAVVFNIKRINRKKEYGSVADLVNKMNDKSDSTSDLFTGSGKIYTGTLPAAFRNKKLSHDYKSLSEPSLKISAKTLTAHRYIDLI